ncbi:unnamed protein product [Lepidochelys kempii]
MPNCLANPERVPRVFPSPGYSTVFEHRLQLHKHDLYLQYNSSQLEPFISKPDETRRWILRNEIFMLLPVTLLDQRILTATERQNPLKVSSGKETKQLKAVCKKDVLCVWFSPKNNLSAEETDICLFPEGSVDHRPAGELKQCLKDVKGCIRINGVIPES